MSACLEGAPPAAPSHPSMDARAARLAKFKREQLIVNSLNRGVSVVEIAARVGVGEKRMRAIIRDPGLDPGARPPHAAPARASGVVAIQLSRLNEALLVAYSAMAPTNLKAVDQVVKIVRELDRYGGAFAAEWARPEASRAEPGNRSLAFRPGRDDRPQNPAQHLAKVKSAPRSGATLGAHADMGAGTNDRPGNPAQHLEKAESAPGGATLVAALPPGQSPGVGDAVDDRVYKPAGAGDRPGNPAQSLEKVDSAPGVSTPAAALPPGQSPGVGDAVDDRVYKPAGADDRPQIRRKGLKRLILRPGLG